MAQGLQRKARPLWDSLLAHVCPFSVRADVCYARSFSWKPARSYSVLAEAFRMHRAFPLCAPDFPGAQVSRLPQLFQQLVA